MLGGFPARDMIAGWLKAGIFEAGKGFAPTGEGTPQGGVISPLLLNIALHGLEEAAGVRYRAGTQAGTVKDGCPALIRYADDLVVCCHSRQQAEQVKARLAEWLEPRGLAFNEAKTRIVPLTEGFDFLGFNLRRYPNGKLLIKPGATAIKRLREQACEGVPRTPRGQRRSGTGEDRPHHPGLGRLLPDRGVVQGVRCPDRLPVEAHLQVGVLEPPEQAETLDHRPVLREVQQVQERPVGIRRPRTPAPTCRNLLDRHRAAHPGQKRGITR